MPDPRRPATSRSAAASARQQLHAEPGVSLLATRRRRFVRQGHPTYRIIDLVRCTSPGRVEVYLKVAFERGQFADYETHLTEAEARACWPFEINCAPMAGLAIPRLLSESVPNRRAAEVARP